MSKANSEISRDVGTELLFENDRVRVKGKELAHGESSPYHRHESDYVYVIPLIPARFRPISTLQRRRSRVTTSRASCSTLM